MRTWCCPRPSREVQARVGPHRLQLPPCSRLRACCRQHLLLLLLQRWLLLLRLLRLLLLLRGHFLYSSESEDPGGNCQAAACSEQRLLEL